MSACIESICSAVFFVLFAAFHLVLGCYLTVDAAVAAQAVRQAGVDPGVAGQAGELVQVAGLEGKRRVHTQLFVRIVPALVHGVTAPPVWDALPIGAVELVHITAGRLRFTCNTIF